jgi:hypothetical protein
LRLRGERQRREARGGENEFELHGSRPFHVREDVIADDDGRFPSRPA